MITMPTVQRIIIPAVLEKYTSQPTATTSYDENNSFLIKYNGKWLKATTLLTFSSSIALTDNIDEAYRFWLYNVNYKTLCIKESNSSTTRYHVAYKPSATAVSAGTYDLSASSSTGSTYKGYWHLNDFSTMTFNLGTYSSVTAKTGQVESISLDEETGHVQNTVNTTTSASTYSLPLEFWKYVPEHEEIVTTQYPIVSNEFIGEKVQNEGYLDRLAVYNGTVPGDSYDGINLTVNCTRSVAAANSKKIMIESYNTVDLLQLSIPAPGGTILRDINIPKTLRFGFYNWSSATFWNIYVDGVLYETHSTEAGSTTTAKVGNTDYSFYLPQLKYTTTNNYINVRLDVDITTTTGYTHTNDVYLETDPQWSKLCFTATEANSSVSLTKIGNPSWTGSYSFDGNTWNNYTFDTTITLANIGDKVMFKGDITANFSASNYLNFVMSGKIKGRGNINSMYVSADFETLTTLNYMYCYYKLFNGCTSLITAPVLPAITLSKGCYANMFSGCTSLIEAPELPATTLANFCYQQMFNYCDSLINAPTLPATTLAQGCYAYMFYGCESLTTAPQLPATTLKLDCYENMFAYCTSLTTAPQLPATTLAQGCYDHMFTYCESLVNAPELPATTLVPYCYEYMFNGCASLVNAPELPATTLTTRCYNSMFAYCTALTTVPELPATTLAERCYSSMFAGCTSLTTVPNLPATTVPSGSYSSMFYGCTSLKVYSASGEGHNKAWLLPSSGPFRDAILNVYTNMFLNVETDNVPADFNFTPGRQTTFYTQNDPV